MTTSTLDSHIENLKAQIESAMSSGDTKDLVLTPPSGTASTADVGAIVGPILDAYRVAVKVNPAKAFQPRPVTATPLADPTVVGQKAWWNDVLNVTAQVAPVIIGAFTKDYNPPGKDLKTIVDGLPADLRNDAQFRAYAADLLLYVGQNTVGVLSGTKDFTNPAALAEPPQPPPGKDWFSDALTFVGNALPTVLPIIMSFI